MNLFAVLLQFQDHIACDGIEVCIAPPNIDIGSVFFYRSHTTVAIVCVPIVLTCGYYSMSHDIYEQRVAHIRGSHVWHFRTRTIIAI